MKAKTRSRKLSLNFIIQMEEINKQLWINSVNFILFFATDFLFCFPSYFLSFFTLEIIMEMKLYNRAYY